MQMPRFGMKSLLILFAAVALWLSTFAQYKAADDVRYVVRLAVAIISAAAATSNVGARRWYWGGFSTTMFALCWRASLGPTRDFTLGFWPSIQLTEFATKGSTIGSGSAQGIQSTLVFIFWLAVSTVIGLLCSYVYSQTNRQIN
jgi:hypothetical protein